MLVGPTASGKTEVSLRVAERCGAEIVSADSMQIYRGMSIGTAKPSAEQRRRVPHHLIDILDPDESYSAARFQQDADQAIRGILGRDRVPLVVGGTGLYVRALLHGLFPESAAGRSHTWQERIGELRRHGENPYGRLALLDPGAASRIHPNDAVRAQRALEVFLRTGRSIASLQAGHGFQVDRYRALLVGLQVDRDLLKRRIHERVDRMIAQGLLEETRSLLGKGYAPELPSLMGLGYRHLVRVLRHEITLDQARERMQRDTRRYAKRQMTWFLNQEKVAWLDGSLPDEKICDAFQLLLEGV